MYILSRPWTPGEGKKARNSLMVAIDTSQDQDHLISAEEILVPSKEIRERQRLGPWPGGRPHQ